METTKKTTTKDSEKCPFYSVSNIPPTFLEKTSTDTEVIPGQAYSIKELLERATRGQRLNVPLHPSNLIKDLGDAPDAHFRQQGDEDFDNVPPEINDRVELDEFIAQHHQRKAAFVEHLKQKKKEKDAAEEAKRTQKKDNDPNPPA